MNAILDAAAVDKRLTLRLVVEDLLTLEAQLLDDWDLDGWLNLYTDDAIYHVPTAGAPDGDDPSRSLFYIADDRARIRYRVERLKDNAAHSEFPRSDSARLISNVRVLEWNGQEVKVRCAFVTYRSKGEKTDTYFGHHLYTLRAVGGSLKIAAKTTMLDMANLRPHGRVSIIL